MYTRLETYLAKENPPTRPDRDFRKSPEKCGDEDSALQGGQIGFSLAKFTGGSSYLWRPSIRRGEGRAKIFQARQAFCHRRQCTVEPAAANCERGFRPWRSKFWWRVNRVDHVTSARSHVRQEKPTSPRSGYFNALDRAYFSLLASL